MCPAWDGGGSARVVDEGEGQIQIQLVSLVYTAHVEQKLEGVLLAAFSEHQTHVLA